MISAALQAACDIAVRTSRRGDVRAGIELARQVYQRARHEGRAAELEALNALGLVLGAYGSFIEAIATSIDAFTLGRQLGDRDGAARALTNLAGAAIFVWDTNELALDILDTCEAEAVALDDTLLRIRVCNIRGLVLMNLGRYAAADCQYQRGLALLNGADERTLLVMPPHVIGGNRAFLTVMRIRHAGEAAAVVTASAEVQIAELLAEAAHSANADAESRGFYSLGLLHAVEGRVEESLAAFERSSERSREIRHTPRLVDTYLEISKLHAGAGQPEAALAALESAYEIADANRPSGKIVAICKALRDTCATLERWNEAAHFEMRLAQERQAAERDNDLAVRDLTAFQRQLGQLRQSVSAPQSPAPASHSAQSTPK